MYLIIQFRKNYLAALHEHRVLTEKLVGIGVNTYNIHLINFLDNNITTKTIKNILTPESKIILGGSGDIQMWDIPEALLVKLTNLITFLLNSQLPTLGICLGHQLLGKVIGGQLKHHGKYEELGFTRIFLTKDARHDPLFKNIPNIFWSTVGHHSSIIKLPQTTQWGKPTILAFNGEKTIIEAIRVNNFWGIQFHPELNYKETIERFKMSAGYTLPNLPEEAKLTPFITTEIFKNFAKI